jgi:peptidoglycan/LPS O-acetylase OafA/YrhL
LEAIPEPQIPQHIAALDGVRGFAILAVLIYHLNGGSQSHTAVVRTFSEAMQFGWSGVTLFFVLSGFLISNIIWSQRSQPKWWRNFYARRALRIFPLYYLALLVVVVTVIAEHTVRVNLRPLAVYALYLQNWPLSYPVQTRTFILGHFWSLAVEEQFYLIWPWLLVAMPNLRRARLLCVVVFLASALFRLWIVLGSGSHFVSSTPAHMGELVAGAWLALTLRDKPEWTVRFQRLSVPALILSAMFAIACWKIFGTLQMNTLQANNRFMYSAGLMILPVGCCALVVLALQGGWAARALAVWPLQRLGVLSYGIYVFHVFLAPEFWRIAHWMRPNATIVVTHVLTASITILITLPLAELSYRLYERPFLRLKRRFESGSATNIKCDQAVGVS